MEESFSESDSGEDDSSSSHSEYADELVDETVSESVSESDDGEIRGARPLKTKRDRAIPPKARSQSERRRRKIQHAQRYQAFFEADTADVVGNNEADFGALEPSWLGGSYWTSAEKDDFYLQLSRSGPDDLPQIARAIGTKTELEVRAYLLLMREQMSARNPFDRDAAPIACELGDECDDLLDDCAERALAQTFARDAERERELFGGGWLVDGEEAARLETADEADGDGRPLLLRPTAMLQLSENLFMNEVGAAWPEFIAPELGIHGPTMLRSALDELAAEADRFTRRLVAAVLFQAESRLHAKSQRFPKREVKVDDVEVAADLLGLDKGWRQYWAALPRRRGLKVYSQSDRYVDGRPSTRMGVALSPDEAEVELGLSGKESQDGGETEQSEDRESDEEMADAAERQVVQRELSLALSVRRELSLALSEEDAAFERDYRSDDSDDSDVAMDEREDDVATGDSTSETSTDEEVAKSPSPVADDDEEDAIEYRDFHRSQFEERRILALMFTGSNLSPPPPFKKNKRPTRRKAKGRKAAFGSPKWRDSIQYMSEWELLPPPADKQGIIGDVQRIREEAWAKHRQNV